MSNQLRDTLEKRGLFKVRDKSPRTEGFPFPGGGLVFNKEEREKEIVNGKKKVRGCGGQSERRRGKKKLGRGPLPAAAA